MKIQTRRTKSVSDESRQRCFECFRTPELCYCDSIGWIENRTEILILQHRRERMHPFNTARIVNRTLNNSRLICERNEDLAQMTLPIAGNAGLLYPSKDATLLTDLSPAERPDQLVILDGTWHHAKTLYRDINQLHALPKFRLAPTEPGKYRIRMEPNATSLSTLEAVCAALRQLEPGTENIDALMVAFNCMIQKQLDHPQSVYSGLAVKPKKIPNANVPKSILHPTGNIVLAYGEATPIDYAEVDGWDELNQKRFNSDQPPVYWCAHRMGGTSKHDRFSCFLDGGKKLASKFYGFMELKSSDFDAAMTPAAFAALWKNFIRDDDLLLIYNRNALKLISNCGISTAQHLTVNGINFDPLKQHESIETFVQHSGGELRPPMFKGRAGRRLETMTSLIRVLSEMGVD